MEQKQPTEQQLIESQKYYSENGLWDKIASVAKNAGLKVVYLALVLYYTATADSTPITHKSVIYGALGYFILPIDLIPDVIPVVGFSDDFAALVACATTVAMCITSEIRKKSEERLSAWFGHFDRSEIDGLV